MNLGWLGWTLTILGFIIFLVFGLLFPGRIYFSITYLVWRLTGGLGRVLKYAGPDYSAVQSAWEALGLSNPQPMTVEIEGTIRMRTPQFRDNERSTRIVLTSDETFERISPNNSSIIDGFCPVEVTYHKVFLVAPDTLYHGCCGKYSLPKALFLKKHVGGDPKCGGGIKHFWTPMFHNLLETISLRRILKQSDVNAYVLALADGSSGIIYKEAYDTKKPLGYLSVFIGENEAIAKYNDRPNASALKPIRIHFA